MALTASHALAPLFSRSMRDICRALSARCRSGLSNIGVRSSESTCMIAWKDATPPVAVSFIRQDIMGCKPMCHWKRAASTSTDAPLIVSMQLTDFSKILRSFSIGDVKAKTLYVRLPNLIREYNITISSRHAKPEEQVATPFEQRS